MDDKLKAADVQRMLGVIDHEVILHGYTYERLTLDVYFVGGELVRCESSEMPGRHGMRETSEYFEADYLTRRCKRWYAKDTHPKLRTLVNTFGVPLSETS